MSMMKIEQLLDGGCVISNITLVSDKRHRWVIYEGVYDKNGLLISGTQTRKNGKKVAVTETTYRLWQRLQRIWYTHGPGKATHKTPPKWRPALGTYVNLPPGVTDA